MIIGGPQRRVGQVHRISSGTRDGARQRVVKPRQGCRGGVRESDGSSRSCRMSAPRTCSVARLHTRKAARARCRGGPRRVRSVGGSDEPGHDCTWPGCGSFSGCAEPVPVGLLLGRTIGTRVARGSGQRGDGRGRWSRQGVPRQGPGTAGSLRGPEGQTLPAELRRYGHRAVETLLYMSKATNWRFQDGTLDLCTSQDCKHWSAWTVATGESSPVAKGKVYVLTLANAKKDNGAPVTRTLIAVG